MMNGFMGVGLIFWILLIGIVVWGIIQFTNRYSKSFSGEAESPMEILKKRYAKGELSKKEFDEMKNDLEN